MFLLSAIQHAPIKIALVIKVPLKTNKKKNASISGLKKMSCVSPSFYLSIKIEYGHSRTQDDRAIVTLNFAASCAR